MVEPSDEALMAGVKRGDQDAFGMLVRRHVDALYNYALRLGRSTALADDLVQDAWLSAWQHAGSFNPRKARVSTWLHRILHNKFIDDTRKKRAQPDEAAVAAAVSADDVESLAVAQQAQALLDKLIDELPQSQQAAIMLTHAQGFNNREVAHILGLSVRATESLLARARNALKSKYTQQLAASTAPVSSGQADYMSKHSL